MESEKPKGFGNFDSLMKKLAQVPPDELEPLSRDEAEQLARDAKKGRMSDADVEAVMEFVRSKGQRGGLPTSELEQDKAVCRRCGHTYAEHDRSDKYTVEACAVDGCECNRFVERSGRAPFDPKAK